MTRRARITPEMAGLPFAGGSDRRVAGLRREEVAMLAGLSVEYYTRMERGRSAVPRRASWTRSRGRCSWIPTNART